jgi:hypothetical protein
LGSVAPERRHRLGRARGFRGSCDRAGGAGRRGGEKMTAIDVHGERKTLAITEDSITPEMRADAANAMA